MKWPIALLVGAAVLAASGSPSAQAAAKLPRPNLVLILADDLGYGDLGCYGQQRIQTPNLDRLAAEGIRFTRAYAGSTVCAPSRCVLMTGLHTGHCRVRGNGGATPLAQVLRAEDRTMARVLKDAGYRTGLVGKWGLGDAGAKQVGLPTRQGFDYFYGYLDQGHAHNYYPTFLWRNEERVTLRNVVTNELKSGAGVAIERQEYSADLIADEALAFIRRAPAQPFFLYFAPTLPHANNEARTRGMEVPDYGEYAARDWPEPQKGHAAMISRLDRDVGRLLALLRELGLERQTLVLFTSDNGPHREGGNDPSFNRSSGPLRGIKRDLYEGGIRVPLIARWPGVAPAGQVCDRVVWFPDFLPTAAELASAPTPAPLDGLSLVPLLREPNRTWSRPFPLYWEFSEGGFKQALMEGDWKLIQPGPGKALELYRLSQDLDESNNLASTEPEQVKRLRAVMEAARTDSPDWPTTPAARKARTAASATRSD